MNALLNILKKSKHYILALVLVCFLGGCADDEEIIVCNDGNEDGCVDTKEFICLGCRILEVIYKAAGQEIMAASSKLSQGAMALMMLGFAIWLALRLLKFVSSPTETNVRQVWNDILKKAFICFVCGFLASTSGGINFVINTIIFPIYSAFLELGTQILNSSITESGGVPTELTVMGYKITITGGSMACSTEAADGKAIYASAAGFPDGLKSSMVCMIQKITGYLGIGKGIAFDAMKNTGNFFCKLSGIIIWCCFTVTTICFTLYLVGGIFQMGIMIMILPIFIMSYAFGPFKSWAKKCFEKIMVTSGFMMCFSIIVALVIRGMVELIIGNDKIFNPEDPEAQMRDVSIAVMCMVLIGFIIYEAMGVSNALVSGILGGKLDDNFQKNFKAVLQLAFRMARRAVGAALTFSMNIAPDSMLTRAYEAYKKAEALKHKVEQYAGRR